MPAETETADGRIPAPTRDAGPPPRPIDLEPSARILGIQLEQTLSALGSHATEAARNVRLGTVTDYVAVCRRLSELARLSAQCGAQLALLDELRYGKLPPPPVIPGPAGGLRQR